MTETQLARDLHGILDKVCQGAEVIVEENSRPVALIKPPSRAGRSLSECIALAKAEEVRAAAGSRCGVRGRRAGSEAKFAYNLRLSYGP